jgi:hypothetical protein
MTLETKIAATLFTSQALIVVFIESSRRHLNARLDRIERKLDGVSKNRA